MREISVKLYEISARVREYMIGRVKFRVDFFFLKSHSGRLLKTMAKESTPATPTSGISTSLPILG